MVHIVRSFVSAAALLAVASAAPMPRPDSAIGVEEPVSAPNGTPTSDTPSATGGSSGGSSGSYGSSGGYGGSSGGYGGSSGGYGGSSGGYNGGSWSSMSDQMSSSTMMSEASMTTSAWMSSETMASSTSSATYSQMTYGSGSSSYGGGYDSCVQQCVASYGQPMATWSASPTESGDSVGPTGTNGATHTIIVAPTQGVLRYIPFSVNASVGDTIEWRWGAGPHTVSQSSAVEVCNKTNAPGSFGTSGQQNKGFVFHQVINDTKPIWTYCGVPGHCQKGMFGGINIGQADPTGGDSSYMPLSSVMTNLTTMSQDMTTMWSMTKANTSGNAYASNWGMNINCAGMTQDAMMQTAQNVMYMQMTIAQNPSAMVDGQWKVTNATSMTFPPDLMQSLAAANTNSSSPSTSGGTAAAASAASSSSAAPAATTSAHTNGAGSLASSSVAVGLVAVAATFLSL